MPEPIEKRGRFRLTAERPRVPAVASPVLAGRAGRASSWSIGGLLLLGPQLADPSTQQLIVSGSGIVALAGAAVVAQLLTARSAPDGAGVARCAAAGMVLIVFEPPATERRLLAGSILAGAGFGAAALRRPAHAVGGYPVPAARGGHVGLLPRRLHLLSLPAVLAIVVAHVALPTTFEIFGSIVAAIALSVAIEPGAPVPPDRSLPSRSRPATPRARSGERRQREFARLSVRSRLRASPRAQQRGLEAEVDARTH
jgi:hypothetical protein